jgi:LysM repeat protein
MTDELLKEQNVEQEAEEKEVAGAGLDPCECEEEEMLDQSYPLTHKKDDCFCLRVYGKTLEAILEAQKQILYCSPPVASSSDELTALQATCRQPKSCPPGFSGRYTVRPGDTMFLIARRFGVSLQALISANPHITNPNLIFPCDVLCVPKAKRTEEYDEEEEEE